MKKIGLKITVILIAIILLVQMTGITSIASDLSDVNKKIEQKEEEIDGIQEEKSDAMKEVATLTAQITDYQNQIDDLDAKIDELNTKINDAQKKVDEAQAEYDNNKALAEERLVVMQESGDTTYLDMLLTSSSITDFISNYYLASELAEADTELLDSIEKERQEVENAKAELENSKKELDTQKASKQSVATQLQASKNQKDAKVASLSADEKQAQAELDQFEADKREIQTELARIAAEEAKKNQNGGGSTIITGNPSASGYIFPVAGLSKANINNKNYPSYIGHTGVDVNINVTGRSVVAVKAGTVEKSLALKNPNGTYRSYGEYVVINHHDGTMTLYAHMLADSRRVQKGQSVSQGQVIGIVGSTGNSSGTHLHFEVLVNGRPVNPLPYLP